MTNFATCDERISDLPLRQPPREPADIDWRWVICRWRKLGQAEFGVAGFLLQDQRVAVVRGCASERVESRPQPE